MRGEAGAFTLKLLLPLPSVNIALLLLSAGEFTAGVIVLILAWVLGLVQC